MQFIPCCLSDFFFHSSGLFCSRHMAFLLPLTHTASQLYFITVAQVLASGLSVPPSQDTCKLLAAHQGTLTHDTRSSDLLNHSEHVPVVLLTPVCGLRSAPPPHGPRSSWHCLLAAQLHPMSLSCPRLYILFLHGTFAPALRTATSITDALKYLWKEYVKESSVFLPIVNNTDSHRSCSRNNVKTIRPESSTYLTHASF